ncbi:MAG TPA: hypothetical protein VFS43_29895 [Polyangiaceae bacterium]|nr:hypothetical protein [Polyangiaceae bacterium]
MAIGSKPGRAGLAVVIVVAALARFGVVAWARGRFPPVGDGVYYNTLALRLAEGLGYTWRWPDGAVTYAAHYPVGYPALLAATYRVAGASLSAAGVLAALLGVGAAAAMHRVALVASGPRAALGAGLAVALDPAIVAYTPALMTEGVTASLLAIAALFVALARGAGPAQVPITEARGAGPAQGPVVGARGAGRWRAPLCAALAGAVLGVATLVRPQSLLFAPFFGALAAAPGAGLRARARGAVVALALSLAVCLPWTLRNCSRMGRCALVSLNGGWNLLIGATPSAKGTWAPLEVPEACRLVFDEAAKDTCFGRVARERIAAEPGAWLGSWPAKWAATFDYPGAAHWYLHDANPAAFSDGAAGALLQAQIASSRLALAACLLAVAFARGPRRAARAAVATAGAACLLGSHAYPGYLALALAAALLGRSLAREHLLAALAALSVAGTALVHGAFFGAGRYALVVSPFVMALAGASAAAAPWRGALAWFLERFARRRRTA